jgi:hypothetical protein
LTQKRGAIQLDLFKCKDSEVQHLPVAVARGPTVSFLAENALLQPGVLVWRCRCSAIHCSSRIFSNVYVAPLISCVIAAIMRVVTVLFLIRIISRSIAWCTCPLSVVRFQHGNNRMQESGTIAHDTLANRINDNAKKVQRCLLPQHLQQPH